jgi:glutaminyl-peptide cyclotransferase
MRRTSRASRIRWRDSRRSRAACYDSVLSSPVRALAGFGLLFAAFAAVLLLLRAASRPQIAAQEDGPVMYGYKVVNSYPHDPGAYTQGLVYKDGFLFESTGLHGQSTLRKVKLETGEVVQRHALDAKYFAEGLTDLGPSLVQLTWQSNLGFVYDAKSFAVRRTFKYGGEGWGLTRDRDRLIMSDGSSTLRFLDASTFREAGAVVVTDHGNPVRDLNELEFVRGEVYANVWHTDRIARIAPSSGRVTGWIDLGGLLPERSRPDPEAVLNGIAYDSGRDRLFVTGKLWPRVFEVTIHRR